MSLLLVYDIVMGLISPLVSLVMLGSERGRVRLRDRLGGWDLQESRPIIWFHGASMGEVRGMLSVIAAVREHYPDRAVLLTSTSPTGLEAGVELVDHRRLLPLDCSLWLGCALDGLRIDCFVVSETELWPSLLRYLKKRDVRCLLINGRISDMTIGRYRFLVGMISPLMSVFRIILVSTPEAEERFCSLGVPNQSVRRVGNSKYDGIAVVSDEAKDEFCEQARLDRHRYTLCLGSIRDGEELGWLQCLKGIFESNLDVQVIIAPRHREKFVYFGEALERAGIAFHRWSDPRGSRTSVLLLDTYGKLLDAYSVSNRAFIGATLVDIGGHNPFEAAAQGCSIMVGPYVQNIKIEIQDLRSVGGAPELATALDARTIIEGDLADLEKCAEEGRRSYEVWCSHQGSTERIFEEIRECLSS
jgi:3-deoxy-D-manno-octulosonic-acid transferase